MPQLADPENRLPKLHLYDYSKWLTEGYHFDPYKVYAVLDLAEECVHTMDTVDGVKAGDPFHLLDWQIYELIVPVFGIICTATGARRFKRVLFFVPRKNGKSGLMSLLMIYMLAFDGETRPMGYSIAKDRKQAGIVWEETRLMIEKSPFLAPYFTIFNSLNDKRIVCNRNNGVYTTLSHNAQNKDGLNASFVSGDEIQMYNLSDEMVVNLLHTSTSTRRQPLEFYFGTMGIESADDPFWAKLLAEAEGVLLDPLTDPSFFPLIYRAAKEDDWESEDTWRKANPSLGPIKTLDYFRQEVRNVKLYPAKKGEFLRLELNIATSSSEDWIPKETWDACRGTHTLAEMAASQRPCFVGVDLSNNRDFTALGLVFPPWELDPFWRLIPRLYLPESTLARRQEKEKRPYMRWREQGLLYTCPGDTIDKDQIFDDLVGLYPLLNIRGVAYDDWNNKTMEADVLKAVKRVFENDPRLDDLLAFWRGSANPEEALLVNWRQGYHSMTGPTKDFQRRAFDGARDKKGGIKHDGNEINARMVASVVITKDPAGNEKPDKSKATDKIDGVVAEIMGLGLALMRTGGETLDEHILSEDYSL